MQVNCYLLQCQVLQFAKVVESKEYSADWLKGGETIFRQGGKFASDKTKQVSKVTESAVKDIGKI
ncbi:hypothetical protein FD723_39745 (plasmid) [Nostoc sp. C052]|uniref:hypothetical protein n=1 Tax=Nostoc sp. C052 TaxID=2576902 RepID=UPI0015C39198|nr:hypothetical protein [Nostoc sp. C052]QLE46346.1 hypothetical protein FD723_39745 [Nostoc sp. C052]